MKKTGKKLKLRKEVKLYLTLFMLLIIFTSVLQLENKNAVNSCVKSGNSRSYCVSVIK